MLYQEGVQLWRESRNEDKASALRAYTLAKNRKAYGRFFVIIRSGSHLRCVKTSIDKRAIFLSKIVTSFFMLRDKSYSFLLLLLLIPCCVWSQDQGEFREFYLKYKGFAVDLIPLADRMFNGGNEDFSIYCKSDSHIWRIRMGRRSIVN